MQFRTILGLVLCVSTGYFISAKPGVIKTVSTNEFKGNRIVRSSTTDQTTSSDTTVQHDIIVYWGERRVKNSEIYLVLKGSTSESDRIHLQPSWKTEDITSLRYERAIANVYRIIMKPVEGLSSIAISTDGTGGLPDIQKIFIIKNDLTVYDFNVTSPQTATSPDTVDSEPGKGNNLVVIMEPQLLKRTTKGTIQATLAYEYPATSIRFKKSGMCINPRQAILPPIRNSPLILSYNCGTINTFFTITPENTLQHLASGLCVDANEFTSTAQGTSDGTTIGTRGDNGGGDGDGDGGDDSGGDMKGGDMKGGDSDGDGDIKGGDSGGNNGGYDIEGGYKDVKHGTRVNDDGNNSFDNGNGESSGPTAHGAVAGDSGLSYGDQRFAARTRSFFSGHSLGESDLRSKMYHSLQRKPHNILHAKEVDLERRTTIGGGNPGTSERVWLRLRERCSLTFSYKSETKEEPIVTRTLEGSFLQEKKSGNCVGHANRGVFLMPCSRESSSLEFTDKSGNRVPPGSLGKQQKAESSPSVTSPSTSTPGTEECGNNCPSSCYPSCGQSCCSSGGYSTNSMSPSGQCGNSCPSSCYPSCSQTCCSSAGQDIPYATTGSETGQCGGSCPQSCSPSCSQSCCNAGGTGYQTMYQNPSVQSPGMSSFYPVQSQSSCPSNCKKTCLSSCPFYCC